MATVFREPNQVKWIGVRPGHNGVQILAFDDIANGAVALYTVGADKMGFITTVAISAGASLAAFGYIDYWNAVPATVGRFATLRGTGGPYDASAQVNFWPPLEMVEGFSIRLFSSLAGYTVFGMVHGWEIDV